MKVPIYERQVGETADTGGRMLTAQVSPATFAAPYEAAAKAGGAAFSAGLAWYEHDLKLKRSTEQARAEQELAMFSKDTALQITKGYTDAEGNWVPPIDPLDQEEEYKARRGKRAAEISLLIKDKTVRSRFNARIYALTAADEISVKKLSRAGMVDKALSQLIITQQSLESELTTHANNPDSLNYKNAYDRLYGNEGKSIVGLFEGAEIDGLLSSVDAARNKMESLSNVDLGVVYQRLNEAKENPMDESDFVALSNDLLKGKYPHLSKKKRDDLLSTTIPNAQRTHISRLNRRADADFKKNIQITKAKHSQNFNKYYGEIAYFKETGKWRDGAEVTQDDLIYAHHLGNIDAAGLKSLEAYLNDQDAPRSDPNLIHQLMGNIYDAENEEELDAIVVEAQTYTGSQGILQDADMTKLLNAVDRKRGNTKVDKLLIKVRKALDSSLDVLLPRKDVSHEQMHIYHSVLAEFDAESVDMQTEEDVKNLMKRLVHTTNQQVNNELNAIYLPPWTSAESRIKLSNLELTVQDIEEERNLVYKDYNENTISGVEYMSRLERLQEIENIIKAQNETPLSNVKEDDSTFNKIIEGLQGLFGEGTSLPKLR